VVAVALAAMVQTPVAAAGVAQAKRAAAAGNFPLGRSDYCSEGCGGGHATKQPVSCWRGCCLGNVSGMPLLSSTTV